MGHEDEFFDGASSGFITPDEIDGRLVLVMPHEVRTQRGKNGEDYDAIFGDLIVLDGKPAGMIDTVPGTYENVMFSAGMMVTQLRPKLRKGKMLLGRVDSQPSSFNKQVRAYSFGEPTPEDIAAARPHAAAYMQRTRERDPFAS